MAFPRITVSLVSSALVSSALVLMTFISTSLAQTSDEPMLNFELGNQTSIRTRDGKIARFLNYFEPSIYAERSNENWKLEFRGAVRAWVDTNAKPQVFNPGEIGGPEELEGSVWLRDFAASYSHGFSKTVFGAHQVSWGETFGFQILDIVNPRNLTDPLILETGWTRIATPLVEQQFFFGQTTLQLLVAPIPKLNVLPKARSAYDPTEGSIVTLQSDYVSLEGVTLDLPEFGGRLSHLFSSGVDFGVLFYDHYNRNVVYELTTDSSSPSLFLLRPVADRVRSFGGSLSYNWSDFVFRADAIAHFGQPLQGLQNSVIQNGTQYRSVMGTDWNSGDWLIGAQYQFDKNKADQSLLLDQAHWLSFQLQKSWLDRDLETSVFVFKGLDNNDLWLQPKITWNVSGNTTLSLRYDFITASANGTTPLSSFRSADRLMSWITMKF